MIELRLWIIEHERGITLEMKGNVAAGTQEEQRVQKLLDEALRQVSVKIVETKVKNVRDN